MASEPVIGAVEPCGYVLDDLGFLPLRSRDGGLRAWALVDAIDFPDLSEHRWHLFTGYPARSVRTGGTVAKVPLWKAVLGVPPAADLTIVHRNGNLLDNTRRNLALSGPGALRALEAHPSVSQLLLEREASRLAGAA